MNAAAYLRVSTREQGTSGLSLAHQKQTINDECQRREYKLAALITEVASTSRKRPQLERLFEQLDAGEYDVLLVTRMDRFCRSTLELATALDRAHRHGWQLVMLDPAVDTTTPYGKAMASVAAAFAELERALISQRTTEGLAMARERGTFRPGEHLRYSDRATIGRIMGWERRGVSRSEMARRLTNEGIPAPGGVGRPWFQKTIARIIAREMSNTRNGKVPPRHSQP
jgi:DNA invertase Pin-like site-specific DNA recombinase